MIEAIIVYAILWSPIIAFVLLPANTPLAIKFLTYAVVFPGIILSNKLAQRLFPDFRRFMANV